MLNRGAETELLREAAYLHQGNVGSPARTIRAFLSGSGLQGGRRRAGGREAAVKAGGREAVVKAGEGAPHLTPSRGGLPVLPATGVPFSAARASQASEALELPTMDCLASFTSCLGGTEANTGRGAEGHGAGTTAESLV